MGTNTSSLRFQPPTKSSTPSPSSAFLDQLKTGVSGCMSVSGEHLKDEGSKSQVIIAGAAAGLVARFFIAPLDVVKIRLQLQTHSISDPLSYRDLRGSPIYKGTIPTIKHVVRDEGITGLWKGNIAAEMMYVSYSAIQFTTYRTITRVLHEVFGEHKLSTAAESFIAGAGAGAISTSATYPLDLLRTRFAAQGTEKVYTSLAHSVRNIYKFEGSRGFFRGLGSGIGQIIPYMGMFFAAYETLRLPLSNLSLPFGSGDATAGIIASVLAKTSVFPLDLVRKRLQVQGPTRSKYVHRNIPVYKGVIRTLHTILNKEGIRGLYRGLTVSLLKAAPASAITMWTYERILRIMIQMEAAAQEVERG